MYTGAYMLPAPKPEIKVLLHHVYIILHGIKKHCGTRGNLRLTYQFTFFLVQIKNNIKSYVVFRRTQADPGDYGKNVE